MKCYIAPESKYAEWDRFNKEHGNAFQDSKFAKAYRESGMDVELLVVESDSRGDILGGSFYFIPRVKFNWFFNQLRIVSGPVLKDYKNAAVLELLLDKIVEIAKQKRVITIPLRTQFTGMEEVFAKKGFKISEYAFDHSYTNVLKKGKEELWKLLSKTQRKKTNRCKKAGINIVEAKTNEDVEEFNEVYQNFAKTVKDWVPIPAELFREIFNNMEKKSKFLLAKYDGKAIAVGLFLLFNNEIVYLANGSDREYSDKSANSLLIWEMIEWGCENGYSILDIYGVVGKPKEDDKFAQGLNFFKSQFGGELIKRFMYTNKTLSPLRTLIFQKIVIPFILPIYKRLRG